MTRQFTYQTLPGSAGYKLVSSDGGGPNITVRGNLSDVETFVAALNEGEDEGGQAADEIQSLTSIQNITGVLSKPSIVINLVNGILPINGRKADAVTEDGPTSGPLVVDPNQEFNATITFDVNSWRAQSAAVATENALVPTSDSHFPSLPYDSSVYLPLVIREIAHEFGHLLSGAHAQEATTMSLQQLEDDAAYNDGAQAFGDAGGVLIFNGKTYISAECVDTIPIAAERCTCDVLSMTRLARLVFPGLPHHVTQRGNRREPIFFEDGDQEIYRDLLAEQTRKAKVEVWAYCLMPNHVHLILTPTTPDGLGRAVGETHRRYTNFINARGRWSGHLFQARFSSVAMDEAHLMAAVRYVSLNPVRARLAARAEDWPWSSVRAHLAGLDDELVSVRPILDREPLFSNLIAEDGDEGFAALRRSEGSGRPVGTADFVADLERLLGRPIARRAPGRKPKRDDGEQTQLLL